MADSTLPAGQQSDSRGPRPSRLNPEAAVWWLAFAYIVYAAVGDIPQLAALPAFSIVTSSSLFILLYFVHSYLRMGWRDATKYFAVAAALGYAFEFLFIETGWLGHYVYTANLSPFLGPVPVFIPLLWAALGYFCLLAGGGIVAPAVLMVLLDLAFDPRFSQTLWRWVPPGVYFGVPIANFVGWFVTALAIFTVFHLVSRRRETPQPQGVIFYLLFGLLNGAVPDFTSGLPEAGAIAVVLILAASGASYLRSAARSRGRLPDSRISPPLRGKKVRFSFYRPRGCKQSQ